jgi:hypothetical protein
MMQYIYLVVGSIGEYSDHTEWTVAAYPDEEAANQHAKLCNEMARGHEDEDLSWETRSPIEKTLIESLDPSARIYYTGVDYDVRKIPFVQHVDEFKELHLNK